MNEILFTYMTTGAVRLLFDLPEFLLIRALVVQVPDSNDTTCEVDTDFELFDGVNTEAIMAALAA